jgi:lipooligosaccharide transport system permease protein
MNAGIDVPQIQRFGALYIASARLKSMSKWRTIIAAVDIGNPLFYLIAVGIGIGVLVEQGSGIMDETVFPTIEGFKWRKLFFAQNSTPITGRQIAIGVYLAALCRALFSVCVYYILLLAFDVVNFGISILLVPIAVLGGGAFGALMLFAAAKIEKEDQFFNILGRLVIMPMFLFSGTFFPLSSMPIYLQPIGWVSPLWHATELGRESAFDYGISSTMVVVHLVFLVTLLVIGLVLATRQFEKRLAK